jgi:pyocin large subunit-like protein
MRVLLRLLLTGTAAGIALYLYWLGQSATKNAPPESRTRSSSFSVALRATQTWGNPASLPDHFARHGADFGARDAQEYARMASELLQRARSEGLPAKVDDDGVLRVFDPRSGAFGAYNRDGTTKTFFKPGSRGYFERQPGQPVDLRTSR